MKTGSFAQLLRAPATFRTVAAGVAISLSAAAGGGEVSDVQMVKDIHPGSTGSDASGFVMLDGVVYFRANDGAHGYELWRTDGTPSGTQIVADLASGPAHGIPDNLAVANGSLYFTAFDTPEATGSSVWRSDGTSAGTIKLTDTYPRLEGGGSPSGPPLPSGFTALNENTVLFTALDPTSYVEPWKTDGTPVGTVRLKDLHPGVEGSVPVDITVFGGLAYFGADDSVVIHDDQTATYDRELFRTDGTDAGTLRVKDINPGPEPSIPFGFTEWGDQLYFRATGPGHGAELWRTDGTEAGTVQVADINPGPDSSDPELFVVANLDGSAGEQLLFVARDATHGRELFSSDGTADGTRLIKDIHPSGDALPLSLTLFAGRLFFNADDGVHGRELWVSDGTDAGTHLFKDLTPGVDNSAPLDLTVVGDRLFFVTIAPGDQPSSVKTRLWATDGTPEGTELVFEEPGSSNGYAIRNLVAIGSQLIFTAPNWVDPEGFSTDHELFLVTVSGAELDAP